VSLSEHYAGRTVLVTGHTGFKGSWLCAWLTRLGARVVGFSLPPEGQPNLFELAELERQMVHLTGDIRSIDALTSAFDAHRPHTVFHMAAQSLVRRSYDEPVATFAINALGTAHVLEACRHTDSVAAVVIVTTDKCYENREWLWAYRENERLGGHDAYSASKACAEIVTSAYRSSFFSEGARVASARAGNVIGGGDWARDRIVPDIVRAAAAGATAQIRNPLAIRPWQHVLEPLAGYLLLGSRLANDGARYAQAWNFGPKEEEFVTVEALARRLSAELGKGAIQLSPPDPTAVHEAHTLRLDSTKARTILGWQPRLSVERAIDLTARWYRAWLDDPGSARAVLDAQIADYHAQLEPP